MEVSKKENNNIEEEKYKFHMRGSISDDLYEEIRGGVDKVLKNGLSKKISKFIKIVNESPGDFADRCDVYESNEHEALSKKQYFEPINNPGYVYFLKDIYTNHYKIGVTTVDNPFDRIKMHVKYNNNLKLNHLIFTRDSTNLEKYIHNYLKETKVYNYTSHEFFLVDEWSLKVVFQEILYPKFELAETNNFSTGIKSANIPVFKKISTYSELKKLIQYYSNGTVFCLALQGERDPSYYIDALSREQRVGYSIF